MKIFIDKYGDISYARPMRYSEPVNRRLATTPRRRALSLLTSVTLCVLTCGPSNIIAEAASNRKIYFYHPDHLGSTSLVTDAQGQVVESVEYTPFGSTSVRAGPTTIPHQFTGQRLDAATGLYCYHARYYDPQLGRFTQPDPVVQHPADPQLLNRYSYVQNNPVKFIDPSGYKKRSVFRILFAAVAAVVTAVVTAGHIEGATAVFLSIASTSEAALIGDRVGASIDRMATSTAAPAAALSDNAILTSSTPPGLTPPAGRCVAGHPTHDCR